MPTYICNCNNRIYFGRDLDEHAFQIFRESLKEEVIKDIRQSDELEAFVSFNDNSIEAVECDVCGRLWINKPQTREYREYIRADPNGGFL